MSALPNMQQYMAFVNQFHNDTVRLGKAAKTEDGRVMTVNAKGVAHKGMIYTVPGYDRDTGLELSDEEAYKRYLPDIEAGNVLGVPAGKEGIDPKTGQHIANTYAKQNHVSVTAPDSAIGFNRYKPSLSDPPKKPVK